MSDDFLVLNNVSKYYGDFTAVENVNLKIKKGEFVTLLGPSGSGKTTILQIIAGFVQPSEGEVYLMGKPISDIPPNKRNIGIVFQDYALFPHMSVFDNVAYSLNIRKVHKKTIKDEVEKMLDLVQLLPFKDRKPSELSGGQQQRVALARALVFKPDLILMDEPLGALDKNLREHVQLEIKKIQEMLGVTIVFVTHDQEEALVMSDSIAVLSKAKLAQFGTPKELYDHPNDMFIASFMGRNNFLKGRVTTASESEVTVQLNKESTFTKTNDELKVNDDVTITIRPENIGITQTVQADDENIYLKGTVANVLFLGDLIRYVIHVLDIDGEESELHISLGKDSNLIVGEQIYITFRKADVQLFASQVVPT